MLTHEGLADLERSLRDTHVLSVYVDGRITDPAVRRGWRVQLDRRLRDLRNWLAESPREERDQLERAIALLEEELEPLGDSISATGWAAFISRAGVKYAEPLPVPMPTMAAWSVGICAAPYVRALKQHRPVIIAVAGT